MWDSNLIMVNIYFVPSNYKNSLINDELNNLILIWQKPSTGKILLKLKYSN